MKKYLSIVVLFTILPLTTSYALDHKNKKNITIYINGTEEKTNEAKLYQELYDLEYNVALSYYTDMFTNDIGIEPTYFMEDIKEFAKCEATIFATEISIDDYKTLMTKFYSDETKSAIRASLMLKAKPCVSKSFPYLNSKQDTVQEYVLRKCGETETLKTEKQKEDWYYCTAEILYKFDMCPEEICSKNGANK